MTEQIAASGEKSARVWSGIDVQTHVLAANGLDDIVWGSSEELSDDGELVDVVLSGEQRLALEHLSEDASRTPNVHLDVVLLPREHNLGRAVVTGRDVTRHLGVLYTGQAEIADFQIAVLVDEDVAGLEVTVDNTGRVDVFQATLCESARVLRVQRAACATYEDLVKEVLDKLLLERPGGEQAVQICAEQLGDEVAGRVSRNARAMGGGRPTCPRGER